MHLVLLALAFLATAAIAQDRPLLVGATVAQTGLLADHGANYGRGLALWAEGVNARGGVIGRKVELKIRDDRSVALEVGKLYEQLLDEDRVDLLIGPMGSAATLPAMAVAEQRRRVIVNATGIDTAVLKRGNRYAFQVPAGSAEYGSHVWDVVKRAGAKRAMIVDRDESGVGARLWEDAQKLGIAVVRAELLPAIDYAGLVTHARAIGVDALIVIGPATEAAEAVKAMKQGAFVPRIFVASAAMQPEFSRAVGQDAEFAIGISPYAAAQRTPANAAFVKAYREKYAQLPGFYAACGYAAGRVLEAALREVGAPDQEKLREALARVRVDTPLGGYAIGKDGAQSGIRPALLQMLQGRREVVWPEAVSTARLVLPYPAWGERQLMKK